MAQRKSDFFDVAENFRRDLREARRERGEFPGAIGRSWTKTRFRLQENPVRSSIIGTALIFGITYGIILAVRAGRRAGSEAESFERESRIA